MHNGRQNGFRKGRSIIDVTKVKQITEKWRELNPESLMFIDYKKKQLIILTGTCYRKFERQKGYSLQLIRIRKLYDSIAICLC